MMMREEARAIYHVGEDAVVHALLEKDVRIHTLEHEVQDLTMRLDVSEQLNRQLREQVAKD